MSATTEQGMVKLSRGYKVVWGLASMGAQMVLGVYGAMLTIFYQDYLGLAASRIWIVSLVYLIWNAINDPLFGYITDSTRSKLGRRIPYMRYTAPFLALTFVLVWYAPPAAGQRAIFWWMLVTMLLYDSCYTIIGLVYSALLPEVTESDAERNDLQISASLFGMAGMVLGFVIPDLFRPKAGSSPSLLPLRMAMIGVAITSMVLIIITTLRVKERPEFHQIDEPVGLRQALRLTFTSKSFLVLVSANLMSELVATLLIGSFFYLTDYVMQMDARILLGTLFGPLLVGIPITTLIRRRLGVVMAQQVLMIIGGIGLLLIMLVPTALIPLCLAIAGFGAAGPRTLTNVLFAQVADEDELRSGVRREGVFFGVNALITKPAQSVLLLLLPWFLEMADFVTREQNLGEIFLDQPTSAILAIKAIVGLIPGIAMLLGALILTQYPLRGDYLAQVKREMLALHAEKHARLERGE
jgi:GPH family glycoside/pentoside/hexuronide:cation symporter